MRKGFRHRFSARLVGNADQPQFVKIGIQFPDGQEVKPIQENYLHRSMGNQIVVV